MTRPGGPRLDFVFLADRVEAIPTVCTWYVDAWGGLLGHDFGERTRDQLRQHLNRDAIPFTILAIRHNEVLGVAQLKHHELKEAFPDREHWLGGVFVKPENRGQGYGSQIIEYMARIAPRFGVRTMHLQTEMLDGGLYVRLGWSPFAVAKNGGLDVLVMERHLGR